MQLTPTAFAEINRLRAKTTASNCILRLRIEQGGCMDWCYSLSLGSAALSDDHVVQHGNLQIVVDNASAERIENLSIDYSEDLMGGGFRFHNAKAVQTCSCGSSFQCA
ncbi:MAG: iron-sulfur cluster assembly accessory protein [Synechococcales cyanobacterium T60_A2020_003]|nr:iron-sulfur cluster assembly accessory protein [Synechococcales cyanobacterium T60_A2020_003]